MEKVKQIPVFARIRPETKEQLDTMIGSKYVGSISQAVDISLQALYKRFKKKLYPLDE
jgi:hypothetical protein